MKKIFGTATMRSGGSLVSNILSYNNKNFILVELIYLFRHMYFDVKFPLTNEILKSYCIEFCLRLKFKNAIVIDPKKLFLFLKKYKIKNINILHSKIAIYLGKNYNKKNFTNLIEYSNGEWRHIDNFLKLDDNQKAFHVIRDPRAILSSFKLFSYDKKNQAYWYSIFNWLDSYNYMKKYKLKYENTRYLPIKFEDLHNYPEKYVNKILNFSNKKKMKINFQKWKKQLQNEKQFINISAHSKKKVFGFSKKRIENWKSSLKKWEVELVEYLLGKQMVDLGYDLSIKINDKNIIKSLKKLRLNKFNKKYLNLMLKQSKGTDLRPHNAKIPKNWGVFRLGKKTSYLYKTFLEEKNKYIKLNFNE